MNIFEDCGQNNINCVEKYIKCETNNLNIRDENGNTPLHYACLKNSIDCIMLLLKSKKVNINIQNKNGNTPLHFASKNKIYLVKLLIRYGANITIKNQHGNTFLYYVKNEEDKKEIINFIEDFQIFIIRRRTEKSTRATIRNEAQMERVNEHIK